ncbi:MAG: helix-turn-helix domain-containing protein [Pyrinomonadaceae bacterium]|nr:helix-turn-helix domain-containing protein [Acidobacteriota bacterium]MCA1605596.1 helix-turn-helix domain-containing protein [Acidobacteriota bacterium]MCA1626954.1 helix-turn-helix domain-containing protein [Acidobacteriota bacterium]
MRPYSQDLREKIVRALEEQEETQDEIADRFSVSGSFVAKLWRRWRETGSCAALAHGGGRLRSLHASEAVLRQEVARQPDATLSELRARVVAHGAPVVCLATLCAELQRLALPRKKSRSTTASATVSG